jgi:DNA-binding NtrC family response regulator
MVVSKSTILIVDDDATILMLMSNVFMYDDNHILTAESGEKGLVKFENNKIDLVISDQNKPGMSGLQFLERVRAEHPDVVTIVLTASGEIETAVKAVNEVGVYQFILKPFNVMDLRLTVKHALEYKQLLEERNLLLQVVTNLEPHINGPVSGKLRELLQRFRLDGEALLLEAQNRPHRSHEQQAAGHGPGAAGTPAYPLLRDD